MPKMEERGFNKDAINTIHTRYCTVTARQYIFDSYKEEDIAITGNEPNYKRMTGFIWDLCMGFRSRPTASRDGYEFLAIGAQASYP